jgi:DNA-binding NtrC family response regulator
MLKRPIKTVLLIENDAVEARLISAMFDDQDSYSFALSHVESIADAEAYLSGRAVSVILLDLGCCSDSSGFKTVLRTHAVARGASIVLLCCLED